MLDKRASEMLDKSEWAIIVTVGDEDLIVMSELIMGPRAGAADRKR